MFDLLGIEATSTEALRDQVIAADADPEVTAILLQVDSPGGTVSGAAELADAIHAAETPVFAHGTGMVASAAFWVASQADRLTASTSTTVGSIGAFATVADSSKLAAEAGVTVHVLRSGEHKGAGEPGSEVTDAQLEQIQATVDEAASMFVGAISRSRDIDDLKSMADGRTLFAEPAREAGLIDDVEDVEVAVATATQGEGMNEDQIKALIADQVSPLKAQLEESQAALAAATARADTAEQQSQAKDDALEASSASAVQAAVQRGIESSRITAENKPTIDAFVAAVGNDPAKVEAFIGTLQPQAKPDEQGALPPAEGSATGASKLSIAWGVSDAVLKTCEGDVRYTTTAEGGKAGAFVAEHGRGATLEEVAR